MTKDILTFLKSYSFDSYNVNRLIVSSFLLSRKIEFVSNNFIKDFIISKGDKDYDTLQNFHRICSIGDFEELIELFEFVISPEDKIITGAVYTPNNIRNYIIENTLSNYKNLDEVTVCDPACGCSGFLYNVAKELKAKTKHSYKQIFIKNIFGLDIQEYSITRSKILLSLLAISEGEDENEFIFNLFIGNALLFNWNEVVQYSGFNIVLGNPPYVCSRNMDDASKKLLNNWPVCSTGHPDLYIPFFQIGISILLEGGVLGFITMNTFFKSINGRALREYLHNLKYKFKILDFGGHQIFRSKNTYTCICIIEKKASSSIKYFRLNKFNGQLKNKYKYKSINYSKLSFNSGWNLSNIDIINKIESIGIPLGDKFRTSNGIATLKNNIYIFQPVSENKNNYVLDSNHEIEKMICKNIINPNKLKNKINLTEIQKKIIFPYIYSDNYSLIDENIFKEKYPNAYSYLYSKKKILAQRDKGKANYENWYAFGRNQSLSKTKFKLLFPHISSSSPNFLLSTDENLYFYNGLAILGKNKRELLFLKKIMSSRLFWFYIINSSKPYGSEYFSLSRNYIKNFGIFEFSLDEIEYIINEKENDKLDIFIEDKYGITL
jgi:adenine-specific DNA-methyltransferase